MKKIWWLFLWSLIFLSHLSAQTFYALSESKQKIDLVDFSTGTVSTLYKIGSPPDSAILNASGQLIYDVEAAPGSDGALYLFDPSTGQNTVLVPKLNYPRDLVFDPGGGSLLISLYAQGKIARYNLTTGVVTKLPNAVAGTLDGIAYDSLGNLFGVVNHNKICQIDPNTGATLQTLKLEPHYYITGGDGMLYDPGTQSLWIAHNLMNPDGPTTGGIMQIPLTESTPPVFGTPVLFQNGNILPIADGITSDGNGNLYISSAETYLVQYNIPTNTIVNQVFVNGVDDAVFVPSTVSSVARE